MRRNLLGVRRAGTRCPACDQNTYCDLHRYCSFCIRELGEAVRSRPLKVFRRSPGSYHVFEGEERIGAIRRRGPHRTWWLKLRSDRRWFEAFAPLLEDAIGELYRLHRDANIPL